MPVALTKLIQQKKDMDAGFVATEAKASEDYDPDD